MLCMAKFVFRAFYTMPITLYHSVESTCSQKVRLVLSEKQLQWQQININLRKGEQFDPAYLKLNRKAVVPTLIHDEKVVRESTVIIEYLDEVFAEPALKPVAPIDKAHMRLLLKAFDEEVHPSVGILSYAIVLRHQMNKLKTPEEMEEHFNNVVDPMRRQRQRGTHFDGLQSPSAAQALMTLGKVMKLMEELLGTKKWLCAETYSLADACAVPYMVRINNIGLTCLWEDKSELQNWFKRAVERAEQHKLEDVWGSDSFHKMVAAYVRDSETEIQKLLQERL